MKRIFKVCTLTAVLGFGASAMADDATGVSQWTGTVTGAPTGTTTKIVNRGTIAHDAGSLLISESTTVSGEFNVTDSSKLIFGIEETGGGTGHTYQVDSLKFSVAGGFMTEVDSSKPEFTVTADGADLDKGTAPVAITDDVRLRLTNKDALTFLSTGDEVVVQATILVTHA